MEGADMLKQTLEYYMARFRLSEEGATAVEYGLLVAVIAIVMVVGAITLGQNLFTRFDEVATQVGP
jgi:pilus assembly protein Flp/PilA